jgi:predicted dinucleotide-binding enzyme
MKKKVGIIGSGVVARALAKGFLYNNYEVLVGSRTPSKLDEWKEQVGMPVQIGSMADAATLGDIIVLATKGLPSEEIIKSKPKLLALIISSIGNPLVASTLISTKMAASAIEPSGTGFATCSFHSSKLEGVRLRTSTS